jgi:MFS family permease
VFYGLCMSVFSAARVLTMPLMGLWADRRPMIEPFLLSVLLGMLGNALYALADVAGSRWLIFFGRMLVGMGAANSTLTMSYITRTTDKATRTRAIATVNGIGLLGIVLGPALNLFIDFDVALGPLRLDRYTNPGWLMFVLLGVIWAIMSVTFIEPARGVEAEDDIDALLAGHGAHGGGEQQHDASQQQQQLLQQQQQQQQQQQERQLQDDEGAEDPWWRIWSHMFWRDSLWMFFIISFVSNFLLSELETALPELTTKSYGWDTVNNSLMYAIIGIVTASSLILTGVYSSVFSDRQFVAAGQVVYGVALVTACLLLGNPKPAMPAFVFVTLFLIVAAPLTDSPNMAAYSKRLSANKKALPYMSLFLGFIDMFNGVSRTVAPLYAGWALVDESQRIRVYIGPAVMWVVSALSFLLGFRAFKRDDKPRRRFSSIHAIDGPAMGTLMQSPMLVATPTVSLHSALTELLTPPHLHASVLQATAEDVTDVDA